MATATFEELFNSSVLDVIVPVATAGFPSPSLEDPHVDDKWLEVLKEETTDRKLAFFDENLEFLLTLRIDYPVHNDDETSNTPPINLLAFLAHLQVTYDASYIASLPSEAPAPIVPARTKSLKAPTKVASLTASHPSIFPPHTPNPIPSSADVDKQYAQSQGTPLRTGVWGDSVDGSTAGERFALLWSAADSCWIAVFRMTLQVSFVPTDVPDPLLCLTVSSTLREKPLSVTAARKPLQALIEAAGGLPTPAYASSPTRMDRDEDEYEKIDVTGLDEVNLLEGLAIGNTFTPSSPAPLSLPTSRLGHSVRKDVFSLPDLTPDPSTPQTTSSTTTVGRQSTMFGSHATLRKSFRKTVRTLSGFRVRMRTVFVPYFMLPHNGRRGRNARNDSRRKSTLGPTVNDDESDSDSDAEVVYDRELREAGNEEHTVILCVEVENAQESPSISSPFGFSVESVKVSVSGEGAQTRLIAWGEMGLLEPERIFPLFLGPSEQYNLLYAVSFLRSPETDDQFSLAQGRGLPGSTSATSELQRAVAITINGRPFEVPDSVEALARSRTDDNAFKNLTYPTPTFPSRWNCVLDLSSNAVSPNFLAPGPNRPDPVVPPAQVVKKEAMPTPASPFPSSGPRTSILGQLLSGGRTVSPNPNGKRSGTATPTMVAGSKRHTFAAMEAEAVSGLEQQKAKPPPSPVNYRSDTAMLNPANVRDPHLQTGAQQNVINAAAAAALQAQAMQNPILGPNSASSRTSYLPPSMTIGGYAKSPTTYGPLSPPLPAVPGGKSFAHFQGRHGAEDSISSFVSTDSSSTFAMAVPPTPAYPAYPTSPPPIPTSPTGRQQKYWQSPLGGGLQVGASVGPSVEIRREKASATGAPQTPAPRVGPGIGTSAGGQGQGGFAQMQDQLLGAGVQGGEGEPIIVSVGLLPSPQRVSTPGSRPDGKIYPLDQFTLDIFVFNQSSWTRRFEVSYPDRRRRRRDQANFNATLGVFDGKTLEDEENLGIVPLENRVRVGPLLPSTCQSVRLDFLALAPGVHSIDTLTLTDIQSGYTMDLRSVIDIVVHEHEVPHQTSPSTAEESDAA